MVIKDRSDRCKKLVKCSCQLRHAKTININNHSKMLINRSCYNSPSKSPSKKNMKKTELLKILLALGVRLWISFFHLLFTEESRRPSLRARLRDKSKKTAKIVFLLT